MIKILKKWWVLFLILTMLLYLIVGAVAPFLHYKKISSTKPFLNELFSENQRKERAMLLESNQSAWEERIRLMNQAEDRIILSTFDMREGKSTRDILALLYQKAEEGISVKIIVDGISGVVRMAGCALFYAVSAHPNIQIKIYNPLNPLKPWTTQGRMHDKYIIVDDKGYILGGRNTFDYFIGSYNTKNRSFDREVLIYNEGPGKKSESSLNQIETYFWSVWNQKVSKLFHEKTPFYMRSKVKDEVGLLKERYKKIEEKNRKLFEKNDYYLKNTCEIKGVQLLWNPIHIYGKEPVVFEQLTQLMSRAKERVIIHTPYLVCNTYMKEELKKISEAVPNTRIILNSVENGDNFFASSDYRRHKKDLLSMGMKLYEYDGGTSYHGKSLVLDHNISVIGSYNFDLRSTYMDTELMLVIRSEELAEELMKNMETIQKDCRYVKNATTYETPEHIKVLEVPSWKKVAWQVIGFIMQPFRCLI
ncbi:MAG: phospholipase D family protein [Acetivibrio sp.]